MLNSFFYFFPSYFTYSFYLHHFLISPLALSPHSFPSISPFSFMIHTKQQGDKIVIAHWNKAHYSYCRHEGPATFSETFSSGPPRSGLSAVHCLLLLYQNLGDLLIPTVIEERLWSTGRDKTLCEHLQAALARAGGTPEARRRDWPRLWTWSHRNAVQSRRRIFYLLRKAIATSLWPGRIGTATNGALSTTLTTFPLGIDRILYLSRGRLTVAGICLNTNNKLEPG